MKVEFWLKNYRCFVRPNTISIQKGYTAFVGVNNVGKSTCMRFFLEFRRLLSAISNHDTLSNSFNRQIPFDGALHVLDNEEVFSNLNENPIKFGIRVHYADGENKFGHKQQEIVFTVERSGIWTSKIFIDENEISPALALDAKNNLSSIRPPSSMQLIANLSAFKDFAMSFADTLYIGPFRNTINVGTRTDYLDIQIGEAFITQFRELKTGPNKKANIGISNLTDDIRRIFGFENLDIVPASDNKSLHYTINSKPYKQHELGSGLSQFVVVLANAAIKRPAWILIDEPELNLHPSLQLDFLTTLGKYARNGVWFSTHSIGLARSAAEQIYSVTKAGDGDSCLQFFNSTPRPAEFLGEMSFSSQKDLGFESLLLVEGPTELKTIQQFLRLMKKDHKILLLPICGHLPTAEELEELTRITPNISALIDSEKDSESAELSASRRAFTERFSAKNLKVHVLQRRALENYFPNDAIKQIFGPEYRSLLPYEKLENVNPHWAKSQNWKIAGGMSLEDLAGTDLGEFIESL